MKRKTPIRSLLLGIGLFHLIAAAAFAQENRLEPSIKIGTSSNKGFSAQLLLPAVQKQQVTPDPKNPNQVFTQLTVPTLRFTTDDPGKPGIPIFHTLIAVPDGAQLSVRADVGNPQTTEGVLVYPAQADPLDQVPGGGDVPGTRPPQPPSSRFADPPFTIDDKTYSSDALYPANPVSVRMLGKMRGVNVAEVDVAAGQYNPKARLLRTFSQVQFFITFEGGTGFFLDRADTNPFDDGQPVFQEAMLNQAVLSQYVSRAPIKWSLYGEEYLILTHPNFRAAADKLAAWKNQKGIITHVFNVNDGAGSGPDTKEQIDAFIENRYNTTLIRPHYILLLGDAEYIPPFYKSTSGSATTGTDYPYALLGAADNLPDFAVGRIPVDTLAQANVVVDKVINYEKTPPSTSSFYSNAALASDFQCCRGDVPQAGTDERTFVEVSEFARNVMIGAGKNVQRIYGKTGSGTPNRYYDGTLLPADLRSGSGFPWNGNGFDISNAFNAGKFLIMHRDHGWEDGWATPGWDTTDAGAVTNGNLLPVVFSVNCASGFFDNETAGGDYGTTVARTYFAETLLRNPNGGAVGVLGDTRNSPSWPNTALARGYFDAIWPSALPYGGSTVHRRLGDILNHGKLFMLTQIGVPAAGVSNSDATSELYLWHCIGDPTLEIWKSQPFRLPIHFFAELTTGGIHVKYDLDGAEITAYQDTKDGIRPLGRGKVINGEAELPTVFTPMDGIPIQYFASFENGISVQLPQLKQKYAAQDFAIGPDIKSRMLWTRTDGAAYLWHLTSAGFVDAQPYLGTFSGFSAAAVSIGADNNTRVLWRKLGGAVMLQNVSPTGAILNTATYGPYAGWTAKDLSTGPDNITRLLWVNTSTGQINIFRLNPTLAKISDSLFGPYPGWTPIELATGYDNRTRVLWNHTSGAAATWRLDPTNVLEANYVYGPYADWKAVHISVGGDLITRIAWQHTSGSIYLWGVSNSNSLVFTHGYAGAAGWSTQSLATGRDNRSGLLWTSVSGQADLWYLSQPLDFLFSKVFGPY